MCSGCKGCSCYSFMFAIFSDHHTLSGDKFQDSALVFVNCTVHKDTLHICPPLEYLFFLICLWSCFHHNMTEHGVRSRCNQSSTQHSASVTAVPETVTCCSFCITCTRHIVLTHIPAWQTCAVAPVPASQPPRTNASVRASQPPRRD